MKKYIEKLQQNSLNLTQPSTSSLEYKSHYKELYKFLDLKLGYHPASDPQQSFARPPA